MVEGKRYICPPFQGLSAIAREGYIGGTPIRKLEFEHFRPKAAVAARIADLGRDRSISACQMTASRDKVSFRCKCEKQNSAGLASAQGGFQTFAAPANPIGQHDESGRSGL